MNTVRGIARDLVDKRLWPIAALLGVGIVAALAFALSASGSDPAQAPGAGAPVAGMTTGVVVPADEVELNADRELVGEGNDPFRRSSGGDASGAVQTSADALPSGDAIPPAGDTALGSALDDALGGALGDGDSGGGAAGGGAAGGAPSGGGQGNRVSTGPVETPEPAARREPDRTFTMWEVDTRVLRDGRQVRGIGDIAPLTPLPTTDRPAALFLGVFNGGSSAGFVIHGLVDVRGSNCESRPERDCSLLRLGEGSDATLTLEEDGREVAYQIVVDDIRKVTTRDERRATAHRERRSAAGSCLLKTIGQDYGAVLFDPAQGTWSAGGDVEGCAKP